MTKAKQEKQNNNQGRLKRILLIAVLVLLVAWYLYLRIQETEPALPQQPVPGDTGNPLCAGGRQRRSAL